jgi:carbon-monoxide dehydrogenase small subunit
MASRIVEFGLNGRVVEVLVKPLVTLQTVLREQLGFTATKSGCRKGGCGSCTVLLNGEPVLSCLLPAEEVAGQEVTTLEGLTPPAGLHPIQAAFHEDYAIQCGYCTSGMILMAKALLDRNPDPSREEIVDAMSGNYCRCTGYDPIIRAIQDAAERMAVGGE